MTVGTLSASQTNLANLTTPNQDLDTKDLGGHFRADLHASAHPYYDRLVALASLWAQTPTGRKVLEEAGDLDAVGKHIKFRAEGNSTSPKPEGGTRTVELGRHLLDAGAREIGVSPDTDHACELMKDVVKALNVLAARIDPHDASYRQENMNPEKLATEFRRELQEGSQTDKTQAPPKPPPPDPTLVAKLMQMSATPNLAMQATEAKTPTSASGTTTEVPADPGDHPYQRTVVTPRTEGGRGRRFLLWMQRGFNNVADGARSLFRRSHAPIKERGETVAETTGHKSSTASATTVRRNSDPANVGLLKRDSREINGAQQEGAPTSFQLDSNTQQESFTPKHQRKKSGFFKWIRTALPGGRTHQPVVQTRDNSLSEAKSSAASFTGSAQKRSSVNSQISVNSQTRTDPPETPATSAAISE